MIRTVCFFFIFALVAVASRGHEGEHWPTPYTAEEIREAWFAGFWVDTETKTSEGTSVRRTTVLEHGPEKVRMRDVAIGDDGEPGGEAVEFESTWKELQAHAEFSRARADRRRHKRETPLGEFEGYLYRVDGESAGEVNEFFFSNEHPGPPLYYRTVIDGEVVLEATQIGRATR